LPVPLRAGGRTRDERPTPIAHENGARASEGRHREGHDPVAGARDVARACDDRGGFGERAVPPLERFGTRAPDLLADQQLGVMLFRSLPRAIEIADEAGDREEQAEPDLVVARESE